MVMVRRREVAYVGVVFVDDSFEDDDGDGKETCQ